MSKYITLKNHLKLLGDFLLDLIFPIECLSCHQGEKYLCNKCKNKIIINRNFFCSNCNIPNNIGNYCQPCQTKHELNGLWISGNYHNKILSQLIKKYKYSFNKKLAPILAELIILFVKENNLAEKSNLFKNSKDLIIIPVPLHKNKKRFRGFNQSEILATLIAQEFKLTINTKSLVRIKDTKAQAKLNKKERLNNVQGAFQWIGKNLNKKNIILVDDVTSTGATLNNCTKTLKANGAHCVWGLVLAKN